MSEGALPSRGTTRSGVVTILSLQPLPLVKAAEVFLPPKAAKQSKLYQSGLSEGALPSGGATRSGVTCHLTVRFNISPTSCESRRDLAAESPQNRATEYDIRLSEGALPSGGASP